MPGNVAQKWLGCMLTAYGSDFFPSRLFSAMGSQGAVLLVSFQALGLFLCWPVSRCAKSRAKSINESGRMWE